MPNDSTEKVRILHGLINIGPIDLAQQLPERLPKIKSLAQADTKRTLLHDMAEIGDDVGVGLLIQKGVDINAVDDEGNKPVDLAVFNGHTQIVDLLLATGQACIDVKTYQIATDALHGDNDNYEDSTKSIAVFNKLVETEVPDTLFHYAVGVGNEVAVGLLIQKGVDINAVDHGGNKPVDIAVFNRQTQMVDLLLATGQACIDVKTYQIATAALHGDNNNYEDYSKRIDIFNQLAAIAVPYTLLHYAAEIGDCFAVRLLIKKGRDINTVDDEGNKPLDLAVFNGHTQIVDLLLATGQAYIDDRDYKNSHGCTSWR